MNLRPRPRERIEINLTSLIDVVFLLLIFFMVSTTFDRFSELQIKLPEADGEMAESDPSVLELVIDSDGRYYIDREQVLNTELETLKRALAKTAPAGRDVPLVINADARTPHQAVITAMDAARQIGLMQISFVIKEPGEATQE
ncbi:MAG: biopolymer transporter ExbD [Gammaproteobacteria bacterium]|nr:MAG: biopolymer transporter ExbD [Gammaproteobacteria bacterium]